VCDLRTDVLSQKTLFFTGDEINGEKYKGKNKIERKTVIK
jgi:hypothetical protein